MLHTQNNFSATAAKRRPAYFISAACLVIALLSLAGCGGSGVAPMSDQNGFARTEVTREEPLPTVTPSPRPSETPSTIIPVEIDK